MIRTQESTLSNIRETTHSEWLFVAGVIACILLASALPFLYAYQSTPPDRQFMGVMLDIPDHMQYFSWMRQLTEANLAANQMTPEANRPVFFNLLWWMLGRADLVLGLGYAGMFQVLRLVSAVLFLLLVYRMCSWFFRDRLVRRAAFLVISLGSGLGWILVLLKYTLTRGEILYPLDVFVAEGNTFLGILGYPHFIAAALYVFVFDLLLRGQKTKRLRYAVGAGLFAQFLGWQHAYDLISIYSVLFAYLVLATLRDRKIPPYWFKSSLIVGVLSVWPAIYSVMLTSLDPLWKEVLAQFSNAGVFTPGPLHLPILFGIPLILALYTLVRESPFRLRGVGDNQLFLRGWFLVTFATIYLPVDYQIHLLNGWQIPIGILATAGFFRYLLPWVQRMRVRWLPELRRGTARTAMILLLVTGVSLTNIYHIGQRLIDLGRHSYPYYLYKDEVAAMSWLDRQVKSGDVVLSSLTTGQYIPAYTGAHAFLAHWAQTVDFYTKEELVDQFFSSETSEMQRSQILSSYSVDYVFFGPAERSIGGFDPARSQVLDKVYSSPVVDVYQVRH